MRWSSGIATASHCRARTDISRPPRRRPRDEPIEGPAALAFSEFLPASLPPLHTSRPPPTTEPNLLTLSLPKAASSHHRKPSRLFHPVCCRLRRFKQPQSCLSLPSPTSPSRPTTYVASCSLFHAIAAPARLRALRSTPDAQCNPFGASMANGLLTRRV